MPHGRGSAPCKGQQCLSPRGLRKDVTNYPWIIIIMDKHFVCQGHALVLGSFATIINFCILLFILLAIHALFCECSPLACFYLLFSFLCTHFSRTQFDKRLSHGQVSR